jgi:hypothetical protein
VVATGSVHGLGHRGWERGPVEGGICTSFVFAANDGLQVEVQLDPGIYPGSAHTERQQRLPALVLRDVATAKQVAFNRLDAVFASEVLRDLQLLSPFKE